MIIKYFFLFTALQVLFGNQINSKKTELTYFQKASSIQVALSVSESPIDPLDQMEICRTNGCPNNDKSGRYGYARTCSKCDKIDDCQKWHGGIDLNAAENTEFKFIYSGKNVGEGWSDTWGLYVMVESNDVKDRVGVVWPLITVVYCHLNPHAGYPKNVKQGQKGLTGKTGNALAENPHLHLEIYDGKYQNSRFKTLEPQLFLPTDFGPNPNHTKYKGRATDLIDCCDLFVRA